MGYYVRAFCTSSDVPTVRTVLDWVAERGMALRIGDGAAAAAADGAEWDDVPLVYKPERQSILCSIERDDVTPESLFREEVREFEEFLEDAEESPAKQRVLSHLGRSQYVVANQLLSDIDDNGYRASALILEYFVQHAGALVQADGEGFYEGEHLAVPLE